MKLVFGLILQADWSTPSENSPHSGHGQNTAQDRQVEPLQMMVLNDKKATRAEQMQHTPEKGRQTLRQNAKTEESTLNERIK